MSYAVTRTYSNGYRCSCCIQHWTDGPDWVDTLEEALADFPDTTPPSDKYSALLSIEVKDGATGETVAKGALTTSSGYGRYSGYKFSRWQGFTPAGLFDSITDRDGKVITDRSWEQILDALRKEKAQEDLTKAKAEFEAATKALEQANQAAAKG